MQLTVMPFLDFQWQFILQKMAFFVLIQGKNNSGAGSFQPIVENLPLVSQTQIIEKLAGCFFASTWEQSDYVSA